MKFVNQRSNVVIGVTEMSLRARQRPCQVMLINKIMHENIGICQISGRMPRERDDQKEWDAQPKKSVLKELKIALDRGSYENNGKRQKNDKSLGHHRQCRAPRKALRS